MIEQKEISRPTLSLRFKVFFDLPLSAEAVWKLLPPKLLSSDSPWIYGTDGKWLRRKGVIINHRDVTNKEIINLGDEIAVWHWQERLIDWVIKNGQLLIIKTKSIGTQKKWWYTHGNLRRAWNLLTKDQDPFFIYLTNILISKSNNALEGVNSQLKQKLGDHRGMKRQQQISFAFWHFTFSRVKNKSDLKKLWAGWKKTYNSRKAH